MRIELDEVCYWLRDHHPEFRQTMGIPLARDLSHLGKGM